MGPAQALVSLEDFLHNPEFEHLEWVDGVVVERGMGTGKHGKRQLRIARLLEDYLQKNPIGDVSIELTCKFSYRGAIHVRLPDVAVVLGRNLDDVKALDSAPDLAIEVRSPDQTVASQLRKMEEYLESGSKLGWLIIPEDRAVIVLAPNASTKTLLPGDTLTGDPLLPGFELALDELFR